MAGCEPACAAAAAAVRLCAATAAKFCDAKFCTTAACVPAGTMLCGAGAAKWGPKPCATGVNMSIGELDSAGDDE